MWKFVLALILALSAPIPASAQFVGPGSPHIGGKVTVAQVAEIRPGTRVILTGNFVQRYRDDVYRFRDETGEILVEVDRRLWRNRLIEPHTSVQVTGEVERSLLRARRVEAERIVVLE